MLKHFPLHEICCGTFILLQRSRRSVTDLPLHAATWEFVSVFLHDASKTQASSGTVQGVWRKEWGITKCFLDRIVHARMNGQEARSQTNKVMSLWEQVILLLVLLHWQARLLLSQVPGQYHVLVGQYLALTQVTGQYFLRSGRFLTRILPQWLGEVVRIIALYTALAQVPTKERQCKG